MRRAGVPAALEGGAEEEGHEALARGAGEVHGEEAAGRDDDPRLGGHRDGARQRGGEAGRHDERARPELPHVVALELREGDEAQRREQHQRAVGGEHRPARGDSMGERRPYEAARTDAAPVG
eukprot:scaffold37494_cov59-Phaeocystis_antarctica.AAC.1